jgi:hypothetical protein
MSGFCTCLGLPSLGFLARISIKDFHQKRWRAVALASCMLHLRLTRAALNKSEFIYLNGNLVVPNLHPLTFSLS